MGNKAIVNDSKIGSDTSTAYVFGGYSASGEASGSEVTVTNSMLGSKTEVYGGYGTTGSSGSSVTFTGSTGGSLITGGYTGSGSASKNTLGVQDSTVNGSITGGQTGTGDAASNTVNMSGTNTTGSVYGGHVTTSGNSCSMKYITDDGVKTAFLTMMNKLIFAHQMILKPLLHSLQGFDDKNRLLQIQEYETKLEKNMEKRQVLTSLMAGGLLEPALFSKENNALILEEKHLQEEKKQMINSVSGDRTKIEALETLIKFASGSEMLTEYSDEIFLSYVEVITVLSRKEIVFELKCGLKLKERLVG